MCSKFAAVFSHVGVLELQVSEIEFTGVYLGLIWFVDGM